MIVALCGLFRNDEVLNHAIEFTGSDATMRSLSVDHRLTISNMTTEWGALAGLFPIDEVLEHWLRYKATESALYESNKLSNALTFKRFSHERLNDLFANPMHADKDAKYAKYLHMNLSTLSPYVRIFGVHVSSSEPSQKSQDMSWERSLSRHGLKSRYTPSNRQH